MSVECVLLVCETSQVLVRAAHEPTPLSIGYPLNWTGKFVGVQFVGLMATLSTVPRSPALANACILTTPTSICRPTSTVW
jgi:hypothetical protein